MDHLGLPGCCPTASETKCGWSLRRGLAADCEPWPRPLAALGQPRGRYDVMGSAPPALDQHLAIDHQPFGSGRLRPARQRNRSACAANKVFVIIPNRQFEGMARAQIDDRCHRMGSADRQEPCPRSRHGRVPSARAIPPDLSLSVVVRSVARRTWDRLFRTHNESGGCRDAATHRGLC
jgi:hypothetical protein